MKARLDILQVCLLRLFSIFLLAGCDTSVGSTQPEYISGIDVSSYQEQINWTQVYGGGVRFAYIKATESDTLTDPQFMANWSGSDKSGVIRGAYHFFTQGVSGAAQAAYFLSVIRATDAGDRGALPPALDVEGLSGAELKEAKAEIAVWLKTVEAALNCTPVIYTSPDTWDEEFPGDFTNYGLWLADYTSEAQLPTGWTSWLFWQYSDSGTVDGIATPVSLDRFSGRELDLRLTTCVGW